MYNANNPHRKERKPACALKQLITPRIQPDSDILRGINFTSGEFLLIASW